MVEYLKEGIADFGIWVHNNAEDITAISVCLISMQRIEIFNELLKGGLSIFTALISSYLVHELKKNNYNLIRMFKAQVKKIKRRENNIKKSNR